ncbi:MAG: aldehyde dehydrogenase family protein [Burkholderiaceae bacterium]
MTDPRRQVAVCFDRMGVVLAPMTGHARTLRSPIDAQRLAELCMTSEVDRGRSLQALQRVQRRWAAMPAPRRGHVLRIFAERLWMHQAALAQLVTLETGKVTTAATGEVQETIDVCDSGVGLSHQLRRAFIHSSVYGALVARLKSTYANLHIGHPAENGTQVGPLIDDTAYDAMASALADCAQRGNRITGGERMNADLLPRAYYVRPALVETEGQHETMRAETFAPILYLQYVDNLDEAIALKNVVAQGLSSCIFTDSLQEAEHFTSLAGSDCAIANVNVGLAGAEIGAAFGGEKGIRASREAGADAWKNYLRRATNAVNLSTDVPLAQEMKLAL